MASVGACFRVDPICNPVFISNYSIFAPKNKNNAVSLGLKPSSVCRKGVPDVKVHHSRVQDLRVQGFRVPGVRVQSFSHFPFFGVSNLSQGSSPEVSGGRIVRALSRGGRGGGGVGGGGGGGREEDVDDDDVDFFEEDDESEFDIEDDFDDDDVVINLKSDEIGTLRAIGKLDDVYGNGEVIDTTIVTVPSSLSFSPSSSTSLSPENEEEEEEEEEEEKGEEDPDVLKWWEVVDPRAEGLSEDEFKQWRGFIDCYLFEEWSMKEIQKYGWEAIKFWRRNARLPKWGEMMNEEPRFALESLETGLEEPEVDKKWIGMLTPKAQRLNEEERENERERQREREREGEGERVGEGEGGKEGEEEAGLRPTFTVPARFILKPPKDWPPEGFKVDPKELEFIHGGQEEKVWKLKEEEMKETGEYMSGESEFLEKNFPRFHMFINQYMDWLRENKERLDEESAIVDPAYYPGRRRLGENYAEGMYELPFIEAGQYYWGEVEGINIYEGIFININAVHDAWVSVKMKDWFKLRNVIHPGQEVLVEILAKRDPWRYRFPIEVRLVEPNIDSLITVKRKYPPIFARPGDSVLEDVAREVDRPLPQISRKDVDQRVPEFWLKEREEQEHPFVDHVRERHRTEQELLDLEELYEKIPSWAWDRYSSVTDVTKLDLEAAREERQQVRELLEEAAKEESVEEVESEGEREGERITLQRNPSRMENEIAVLQKMHVTRQIAQKEAVQRDIAVRLELGLPLEEWGRFGEDEDFGIDPVERLQRQLDENRDPKLYPPGEYNFQEEPPIWSHWATDSSITTISEKKATVAFEDPWSQTKNRN